MIDNKFHLNQIDCLKTLELRLKEPAPGRVQLLTGPRQVGKTMILLRLEKAFGEKAIYSAADSPEAALGGYWERLWNQAEDVAMKHGQAVVLLDEIQHLEDWAVRLKGEWDRFQRNHVPVHIVATGSSALRLNAGSKESLAGRIERITLAHWDSETIAKEFNIPADESVSTLIKMGSYPGSYQFIKDLPRWQAYIRDSIIEPAISHDILTLSSVRKPALLRQVFAIAVSSPAQIVSLNKFQGQLQDRGALETIAQYLALLEEGYLVASLEKYTSRPIRRRASAPKLVTLNNALLSIMDPRGIPEQATDPARFGMWVENACLSFAWNSGQRVTYWRKEPFEVDGIFEGSWGKWVVEVKTGPFTSSDLKGLFEFSKKYKGFRPLVICDNRDIGSVHKMGIEAISWQRFLLDGPPSK